jgi:hypothetical protein
MTDHKAFIITAHFEDFADRFLVLKQGDRVLATIAEPTGPGGNRSFGVWTWSTSRARSMATSRSAGRQPSGPAMSSRRRSCDGLSNSDARPTRVAGPTV